MNRKFSIMLGLLVIFIVCSAAYALTDSELTISSPDTLKNGDGFNLTLKGVDGTPIANEIVNITVTDAIGQTNNITAKTDGNGFSSLLIQNVNPGDYNFNCTFHGNDKFGPASADQNLTIEP